MKRIIDIYAEQMLPNQMKAFHYRLQEDEEIVGFMSIPDSEVSLAVKGGTKIVFESLPLTNGIHLAPKDSIIPFTSKSNFIKGSIRNKTNTTREINLYLILQYKL